MAQIVSQVLSSHDLQFFVSELDEVDFFRVLVLVYCLVLQ